MVVNPDGSVQFEGDAGKLMRGGANAAAPGADLASANRAARIAKYGPEAVNSMEAAGSRFGASAGAAPAAPISTPTATNPAPVASAAAESGLTFGQRALRALRFGGRALGAAGIGLTAYQSGSKTYNTPTEDYEKRFGIGPSNLDSPALRFGRDLAVRSAGALVDLGDTLNPFASTGNALAPAGGASAAAAPAAAVPSTNIPSGVSSYAAPSLAPGEVQDLINGKRPVPALGTGAAVNSRTGRTLAFNTGVPAVTAPSGVPVDQTGNAPSTALPSLGTKGGIFDNFTKFAHDVAVQRGATAASGQSFNRYLKTAGVETKQQEAQARGLAATGTYLRGAAAVADAGDKNKKVTVDAMGNPVIVDTKNQTALAPKVNQPVTESDIAATMKANKMSREAVLARLRAEGRM